MGNQSIVFKGIKFFIPLIICLLFVHSSSVIKTSAQTNTEKLPLFLRIENKNGIETQSLDYQKPDGTIAASYQLTSTRSVGLTNIRGTRLFLGVDNNEVRFFDPVDGFIRSYSQ